MMMMNLILDFYVPLSEREEVYDGAKHVLPRYVYLFEKVKYEFCKLLDNVQSNFARTVIQAKTLGVC